MIIKIFRSVEKELENIYIPKLVAEGNTLLDSKKIFARLLKIVKKESELEKTSNLPNNFGNIILRNCKNNDKAKTFVENLRKEGVRDEDIRWWWNMHDLERRIIEKLDDSIRITAFINNCRKGMSKAKAAESVRKLYPIYGDPKDESYAVGDNRSLPDELRNRVNAYIEKKFKDIPEEVEKFTSFNAFIRNEIRKDSI